MKDKKIAKILLLVLCFISGIVSFSGKFKKQQAESEYEKIRETVVDKVVETEKPLIDVPDESDFYETVMKETIAYKASDGLIDLMEKNQSVVGWVKIDNTNVNYPIVQDKADNEYFLYRDINGKKSAPGSIYLDSNHGLSTTHLNVIYGHNMKNGTMFKDIAKFISPQYMEEHSNIEIYTDERKLELEPIHCYAGVADGSYRNILTSPEEAGAFLKERIGQNITGNIFVFVTCSYTTGSDNERTYLICREREY